MGFELARYRDKNLNAASISREFPVLEHKTHQPAY